MKISNFRKTALPHAVVERSAVKERRVKTDAYWNVCDGVVLTLKNVAATDCAYVTMSIEEANGLISTLKKAIALSMETAKPTNQKENS